MRDGSGPVHFVLACVYARQGREKLAGDHLQTAYRKNGPKILEFADKSWAAPVKALPAYQTLASPPAPAGTPSP